MLVLTETFLNIVLIFLMCSLVATLIWQFKYDCFACRLVRLITLILLGVTEVGLLIVNILTGNSYFLNIAIIVLWLICVPLASIRLRDKK